VGHSFDPVALRVYHVFFGHKALSPNLLTLCGAIFGVLSALCIGLDRLVLSAIFLFISGVLDVMDGAVARSTNNVTSFGGFLDSVLDRYTDLLIMGGILVFFLRKGAHFEVLATFVAAMGVAIIPYARARAEAALLACKTGLLERPERLIILFFGLVFNVLQYAVIFLAVFTHVTVIQRILHTRREASD
jgi:CDP-diacylglycerol--glycerol-3-phosphate 3-phosphatidyltransferase